MFKRNNISVLSNPCCSKQISSIEASDFFYFDKDGFELNKAEQLYYKEMNYDLDDCLNHYCFQQRWFESQVNSLIIDHSLILQRCYYEFDAKIQLMNLKNKIPQASLLLQIKPKWGFDFALDSIDENGDLYEVLHIEYDSKDHDIFVNKMLWFEFQVRHTDWIDAAKRVLLHRDQWQYLKGFEQNHWKAKFLIGWTKAEYVEKIF